MKKQYVFIFLLIGLNLKVLAQPFYPIRPFDDIYRGNADSTIAKAKLSKHNIFYKLSDNGDKVKYIEYTYNLNGQIDSMVFYNLLSQTRMYKANYFYDKKGLLVSCSETISKEFDDYSIYFSKKLTNEGYFADVTDKNPNGVLMPADVNGNITVTTYYSKGANGKYIAKKSFHDGSFYKDKLYSDDAFNIIFYQGLYINEKKNIDFNYSNAFFIADTIVFNKDSFDIMIKDKNTSLDCFKISKRKVNNEFSITDIDIIAWKLKILFSYNYNIIDITQNIFENTVKSATYISYDNSYAERLLLLQKFEFLDTLGSQLHTKIELQELYSKDEFLERGGCLYLTKFKNGYLFHETQYVIANELQKLKEIEYGDYNLIKEITSYPESFRFKKFSNSFDAYQKNNVKEIHEYMFFKPVEKSKSNRNK